MRVEAFTNVFLALIVMFKKTIRFLCLMGLAILLVTGCYQQLNDRSYYSQSAKLTPECRKVKHILGESCVPLTPQRIIVTDQEALEIVVALGLEPLGTVKANIVGSKARVLPEKIGEIIDLGKDIQPNLEKIVLLHPDLILGLGIGAQNYDLYSRIAPTVTFDFYHAAWKDNLRLIAQALGKIEQAEKLLFEYDNKIKKIREQLNHKQEEIEISITRFYAGYKFTQFQTPLSFSGSVFKEIGFTTPQKQIKFGSAKFSDGTYGTVNQENLQILDSDILFIALDPGSEKNFKRYQKNPLWQQLNVVKNQRVYTVDSGYWIFGNILSANAILDDIYKYVLDET